MEQGICNRCKKLSDNLDEYGLCHDCQRLIHCEEEAILDRNRIIVKPYENFCKAIEKIASELQNGDLL